MEKGFSLGEPSISLRSAESLFLQCADPTGVRCRACAAYSAPASPAGRRSRVYSEEHVSCCFLATWDFYRVSVVSPLCLFPVFSSLHSPKGLLVCFALDTTHMAVHCSHHGIHCMVLNTCDQQMAAMYHTTSLQGTGGQEFWLILSLLLLDISQQRCLESRQTTSRAQK